MKIYHNPNCSKSNCALDLIKQQGIETEIIDYVKNPPSKAELTHILKLLNKSPKEIIRQNEVLFKQNFENKDFNDEEWIDILVKNPILIERPIVLHNDNAVIARPAEKIMELIK
ncbi:arsenate reductase (glutaredoxin) [Sphingobacterium kyonggiense]